MEKVGFCSIFLFDDDMEEMFGEPNGSGYKEGKKGSIKPSESG